MFRGGIDDVPPSKGSLTSGSRRLSLPREMPTANRAHRQRPTTEDATMMMIKDSSSSDELFDFGAPSLSFVLPVASSPPPVSFVGTVLAAGEDGGEWASGGDACGGVGVGECSGAAGVGGGC